MLIEIPAADGTAEALVARPSAGSGPFPGVILYMDAFGLRPRIQDMAQRIADWGFVVLAPNVFYREGTAAELAPDLDMTTPEGREAAGGAAFPRVGRLTTAKAQPDITAWVEALGLLDCVAPGPIGVVGYCMGARLAVRTATAHPDVVAACGGFHGGGLATDAPDSPHLGLGNARARFVFGHADHDQSMNSDAVARLGTALDGAGLSAANEIYAGAPHGYSMADTSAFHPEATERHFRELRDLLDGTLKV
ncbi:MULTISPECIES: dienelactone hydrolase family protein [unclassified Arthrobacter]|uniref:dienelactone hydrolase family protein n=1 Tax=unclassified Arthrobacter TaxID=235627 RepID=UPI002E050BBA|nr:MULTISPECIES: dienelactone hydrolase family protein [unclassified Arthrobacter]MEC5192018.1 carboxymethylenebutenolidase [Arthrobacter sp. MP_M4]MEC5203593.1 carboxymethylenebutenolidase [Arthrobacter sp. MP_M7]